MDQINLQAGTSIQDLSRRQEDNIQINSRIGIEDLARDINNTLDDDILESIIESNEEEKKQDNPIIKLIDIAKDGLLLLIIFVILSQPFVRNFVGKYFNQINPDDQGNVSLIGVTIYGLILVVLYLFFRQLLL